MLDDITNWSDIVTFSNQVCFREHVFTRGNLETRERELATHNFAIVRLGGGNADTNISSHLSNEMMLARPAADEGFLTQRDCCRHCSARQSYVVSVDRPYLTIA